MTEREVLIKQSSCYNLQYNDTQFNTATSYMRKSATISRISQNKMQMSYKLIKQGFFGVTIYIQIFQVHNFRGFHGFLAIRKN